MRRRRRRWLSLLPFALAAVGMLAWLPRLMPVQALFLREEYPRSLEQAAREHFRREHPGERPYNERIARAAAAFRDARPMGPFILGVNPSDEGNDCSDFVNCAIDEGLGAKARFKRHSSRHLVARNPAYFDVFVWDRSAPLLPGDSVAVEHSPWYAPYPGACWHVGVIGPDGMVCDFVKLRSWPNARYGHTTVAFFTRHAPADGQVVIGRLKPQYRWGLDPIAIPHEVPGSSPPLTARGRTDTSEPDRASR